MSDTVQVLGHVDDYLKLAQEYNVSDVHLAPNAPPKWRRYGLLQPIWENSELLTAEDTERLASHYLPEPEMRRLEAKGDVDFAYVPSIGRFRASVVKTRLGWEMVFRVISTELKSMDELGLPQAIKPLLEYHNGLVLVTGAVGSGKSTTLAALVNEINHQRNDHIITLEDPIEYVIESSNCHVNQREVHTHTESFSQALRAALREDPDVIMVGEMRDLETISLAITAAETGHLVLATLHTGSAARTLDRILDVFPTEQREQIRIMVGESLRGVISQQLVPKKDGTGRELALELLVNTPAVSAIIRDGKTFMLPGVMQTGKNVGMIMMDDALARLYHAGTISKDEALGRAIDRGTLKATLG
ncbi:MAG: type IV pilus twitching motility protein PilT [Verrucomicrobiales bacterium]|nr:type IV pilus twitching motility protein PilT [Verrucomicrobiales bacterium]HQW29618.1 type IV pilus twitching motility protein PilT [Verrucomicrobiales bacterium]